MYKAVYDDVHTVALKVLQQTGDTPSAAMFEKELAILRKCHNNNIVQFFGACLTVWCAWGTPSSVAGALKACVLCRVCTCMHVYARMCRVLMSYPHVLAPPQDSQSVLAFEFMEHGDLFKWLSSGTVCCLPHRPHGPVVADSSSSPHLTDAL